MSAITAPLCRLCQVEHWSTEQHRFPGEPKKAPAPKPPAPKAPQKKAKKRKSKRRKKAKAKRVKK